MELYAEIILPIALPPLTFAVDEKLCAEIRVGQSVEVQIGARKFSVGIVYLLHNIRPDCKNIKTIRRILRPEILVPPATMSLWEWMAEYYMCTLGEVMRAAFPSALKPSGLSQEAFNKDIFKLRTEQFVCLDESIRNEEQLNEAIESVSKRAKARYNAIMCFCRLFDDTKDIFTKDVPLSLLTINGVKKETVRQLVKQQILSIASREIKPREKISTTFNLHSLSAAQQKAFSTIKESFKTHPAVLLHGITGSGKTEIYAHLIGERLKKEESVLLLLPEIANLKQIAERLKTTFGECVTVYNSKLPIRERTEIYLSMCHGTGGRLVIGVRSAMFLPIKNLKLIIVDEEHDRSFKQDEPSPRYSARDCAVWLAHKENINTLLGSATPSIESFYNALAGKYGFVKLDERFGEGRLPHITISDTIRSAKRGERKAHANKDLLDLIEKALNKGRQIILFQNRRGFAPYIECPECGWTARCQNCSVTMTYHKKGHCLRCHHCGHTEPLPEICPKCKKACPETRGFGTEQIEEDFSKLYPNAVIDCLDADNASTNTKYQRIIDDFEHGRTDILVGTQMITKSFDFPKVDVVGILNADNLLNYPDFRATERTFQSIIQVAGRAGRRNEEGEVVVQTSMPSLPVFSQIASYDYQGMYANQITERRIFAYPPFARLIKIILKHRDNDLLRKCSETLADTLTKQFGDNINGPYPPLVNRIGKIYIMEILLKIKTGNNVSKTKSILASEITSLKKKPQFRQVAIMCNVDPQ